MKKQGVVGFTVFVLLFILFVLRTGMGNADKPLLEKAVTGGTVCEVGSYKASMVDKVQRDYIISNHGDLLSHAGIIPGKDESVRDRVVRLRDRGASGLASCVKCHRSKANFCDRCHDYVGVSSVNDKSGCFACHFYPDNELEWLVWQKKMETSK